MKRKTIKHNMAKPGMMKNITMKYYSMKRGVMITVCCALLLCGLTGCQLAKASEGSSAADDRLIGVLITTEYLDLFDFSGYLQDNLNNFHGGDINLDGRNTDKYQGRLYAVLVPKSYPNGETGDTLKTKEYTFEGINGIQFSVPTIQATENENSYVSTMSDPAVSDCKTAINVGDDTNSVTLEGTIYVTPFGGCKTYYFNPVYQSADGSVYAVSGNAFMVSGDIYSEGFAFTQTLAATTTVTENGKTKTDDTSVKVSINVMIAPLSIVVLQMGADSELISRAEYAPDAMPEAITLETGTAYFIVETYKQDNEGRPVIAREIYDRNVENFYTFAAREDGICVKHTTRIAGNG